MRNKNPNCNHNASSVFYQPHYSNVKYQTQQEEISQIAKKEEVLRSVFFKESAKAQDDSGKNFYQLINAMNNPS